MPSSNNWTSSGAKTSTSKPFPVDLGGQKTNYTVKTETNISSTGQITASKLILQDSVTSRSGTTNRALATSTDGGKIWEPTKDASGKSILSSTQIAALYPGNKLNTATKDAAQKDAKSNGATQTQLNQLTNGNVSLTPPQPDPPASAPTSSLTSPDPQSTLTEKLNDFNQVQKSTYQSSSGNNVFRYPLTQSKEGTFDYLKIDVFEYVQSSLLSSDQKSLSIARPSQRLGTSLATVILPMQPNISDSNGVSWNEDQLNAIQGALAGDAYNAIQRAASLNNAQDLVQAIQDFGGDLAATAGKLANSPGMSSLIAGFFAGQAVGANVINRATGAVINNNLELLFHGPKLRTFRYSYKFTPRDKKEAQEIRSIIRLFKREMAPSLSDTGLFLQTPNVFKLKYIYNGDRGEKGNQHPYLNAIKPCALTNFSVNYTPDGTYMTYADGGSMTSYQVDMEFAELDPIYKNDYKPEISPDTNGMGY
jgi:hypothetical protein